MNFHQMEREVNLRQYKFFRDEGEKYFRAGAYRDALSHWQKALQIQKDPELVERFQKCREILQQVEELLREAEELGLSGRWEEALQRIEQGFALYAEDHELLVSAALFRANWERNLKLWKELRKCRRHFRLFRAMEICRELLYLSPQDSRIAWQMVGVVLQGGLILALVLFAALYVYLKF